MNESIYNRLQKYLDANGTTYMFAADPNRKQALTIYAFGEKLEGKKEEIPENNNLEEILEDLNAVSPQFTVQNAAQIFSKGGINISRHVKEIQAWIEAHPLDQHNLAVFTLQTLNQTDDLELLRFALLLGQHLEAPSSEVLKRYVTFAALDETYGYALPLLKRQPDSNGLLFQALKISSGSALVELIDEEVEPDDEEKVRWMLHDGRDPFLNWYYTAAAVSAKCRIDQLMEKADLPQDELIDIGRIVSAYFEEGFADQMKRFNIPWKSNMLKLIALAEKRPQGMMQNLYHMHETLNFVIGDKPDQELLEVDQACLNVLHNPEVRAFFEKEVKENHACYDDALILGISCEKEIAEDLSMTPPRSIGYLSSAADHKDLLNRVISEVLNDPSFEAIHTKKELMKYFPFYLLKDYEVLLQTASEHMLQNLKLFEKFIQYGAGKAPGIAACFILEGEEKGTLLPDRVKQAAEPYRQFYEFFTQVYEDEKRSGQQLS